MSEFIGPALPPGLHKEEDELEIGPVRPSSAVSIGPQLPPNLRATTRNTESDVLDDDSTADRERSEGDRVDSSRHGPSLPSANSISPAKNNGQPTTTSAEGSDSYGPSLPPGFEVRGGHGEDSEQPLTNSKIIGPALPPTVGWGSRETEGNPGEEEEEEEEEEDVIGPVPMMGGVSETESTLRRRREFESRSKAMKDKLLGKDIPTAPQREEWMTELPPELRPSGIGPRKFRTTASDLGDRSVWTDTPADRQRKAQEAGASGAGERETTERRKKKAEVPDQRAIERDRKLAAMVEEHNKKHRSETLMEMHRKKRKVEEREKGKGQERRPFDRETDLDVRSSVLTPTKRKAMVKDSRGALDTKFTHGSRSFL